MLNRYNPGMNLDRFHKLPDESRVWINGFADTLADTDQQRIRQLLQPFCATWQSHGDPVTASFDIWLDRFVITAAATAGGVSGCSTDGFVRNFKQLRAEGLDGLNGGLIYYRDNAGRVRAADHLEFDSIVASGQIQPQTRVFDTLLNTLAALRQGRFEQDFCESWHARRYRLPAAGSTA